jgi:hypothetical protein
MKIASNATFASKTCSRRDHRDSEFTAGAAFFAAASQYSENSTHTPADATSGQSRHDNSQRKFAIHAVFLIAIENTAPAAAPAPAAIIKAAGRPVSVHLPSFNIGIAAQRSTPRART